MTERPNAIELGNEEYERSLMRRENFDIQATMTIYQAKRMKTLTGPLPTLRNGLPLGFWLCDVALAHDVSESESNEREHAQYHAPAELPIEAWSELDYLEGFPTIGRSGIPFWERLPHEPIKFFDYFKAYLEMGADSARHLHGLPEILMSADGFVVSIGLLKGIHDLYYWSYRALAYDMFRSALRERERVRYGEAIEDGHATVANTMFEKGSKWIEANFDKLTSREKMEALKMSIGLQRIVAGFPANGPKEIANGNGDRTRPRTSEGNVFIDTSRKELHLHAGSSGPHGSGSGNLPHPMYPGAPSGIDLAKQALSSPETIAAAENLSFLLNGKKIQGPVTVVNEEESVDSSGGEDVAD